MILIDTASPTPPFEQLRAQLARQFPDRSLAVGTRLPPIRRFAADLGLAVNSSVAYDGSAIPSLRANAGRPDRAAPRTALQPARDPV
ncbi:hypothetical protein [Actinomadura sp. NPDC049753]|uniref:hypothetical protein n=1 Tax=Actinomadura sp. NPDC049753 TaxID=3154739 RepID=UPI00341D1FFA